jgi:hypothetical protein
MLTHQSDVNSTIAKCIAGFQAMTLLEAECDLGSGRFQAMYPNRRDRT